MTKVVNRFALATGAVFLIFCGLFPKLAALVSIMPQSVLGGFQQAVNKASGVVKCQCRTVMVGYDIMTKEPVDLPKDFKERICDYEGKSLEELSKPLP